MAYALVSGGSITGPIDGTTRRICVHKAVLGRTTSLRDVTQSGDGTVGHFASSARMLYTLQGSGWYQESGDSGVTWTYIHLGTNQTSYAQATTSGELLGKPSSVILTRNMEVINVTNAATALTAGTDFEAGKVDYDVELIGFLEDSENSIDDTQEQNNTAVQNVTLTIPDGNGTIAGAFRLDRGQVSPDFARGGPMPANFKGKLHDTITLTNTIFSINSFTAAVDLNPSTADTTGTGTLLLTQLRAAFDYQNSGPVPIQFAGVYDGKVTFT